MRPSHDTTSMLITFLYYADLPPAMAFYEDVLGLPLAIDQGWSKIYKVSEGGYVGLVDEAHGSHKAHPVKPVQVCLRVGDVDAWCDYLKGRGVIMTKGPKDVPSLGIRVIVFNDPEGYQIEIQCPVIGQD
ncbi:MAG: VOC family protein [Hyphomicrobiales bacterium]|nr:VOC family protein [Hyphomicrobiales bacterium]